MRKKPRSDCEGIMEDALKSNNINYSYDYPPRCKYGYRFDFALVDLKIDIECDGEAYHKKGNSHDRKRDGFTKSKGWVVLRFPRQQILTNIQSCINKIKETITRRSK